MTNTLKGWWIGIEDDLSHYYHNSSNYPICKMISTEYGVTVKDAPVRRGEYGGRPDKFCEVCKTLGKKPWNNEQFETRDPRRHSLE